MDLWSAPVEDVRPVLTRERQDLLALLSGLSSQEWVAASAAPGWTVKDLALHLLDDDLGWLSRGRDADRSGLLDMSSHSSFVQALAAKNQRWVDGAQGLSLSVVTGLLRWVGREMDDYYASINLRDEGGVSWASDGPVPQWFDIAQDLTERWVHQMQMREAIGKIGDYAATYLPAVLRTFVWALPHQFAYVAPEGSDVAVDLGVGGRWSLASYGSRQVHRPPERNTLMTSDLDVQHRHADAGQPLTGWRARFCARFRGVCELLRLAHQARVPF